MGMTLTTSCVKTSNDCTRNWDEKYYGGKITDILSIRQLLRYPHFGSFVVEPLSSYVPSTDCLLLIPISGTEAREDRGHFMVAVCPAAEDREITILLLHSLIRYHRTIERTQETLGTWKVALLREALVASVLQR